MTQLVRPSGRANARRILDIEEALVWAYCDELPKRGDRGGRRIAQAPRDAVAPMWRGTPSGNEPGPADDFGGREPGFPTSLGNPHPDAIAIEDAVGDLSNLPGTTGFTGADLRPDMATFGVDIGREMVRAAQCMDGLVITTAKLRRRPAWRPAPRFRPVTGRNGKPKYVRAEDQVQEDQLGNVIARYPVTVPCSPIRGDLYPIGAFAALVYEPDPAGILRERAEYLAWWIALERLARRLAGRLGSIAVLSPSAPARPWAGERDLGKPPPLFTASDRLHFGFTPESAAAERRICARRGADVALHTSPRLASPRDRKVLGLPYK